MKNVISIIQAHGGLEALKQDAIRIDPPGAGLMRLCIEHVLSGTRRGTSQVSVAHYYEQNGDLMQDPEIVAEVPDDRWDNASNWTPVFFQQASPPVYQEALTVSDGKVYIRPNLARDIKSFMATWDKNIGEQGYVEAFQKQKGEEA